MYPCLGFWLNTHTAANLFHTAANFFHTTANFFRTSGNLFHTFAQQVRTFGSILYVSYMWKYAHFRAILIFTCLICDNTQISAQYLTCPTCGNTHISYMCVLPHIGHVQNRASHQLVSYHHQLRMLIQRIFHTTTQSTRQYQLFLMVDS